MLDFNNTEIAFSAKSQSELKKCLSAVQYDQISVAGKVCQCSK